MNDSQLVMEHARKFAAQFSGFLKACEIIGNSGALEQLADEAQKRYDDLAGKADELAAKQRAADEKAASANAVLEQANGQAGLIKKIASDEADDIRTNAVTFMRDARAVIGQERADALAAAHAAGVKIITDTHASLDDVSAKVAERSETLAALDNAIATRQSRLEQIKQDIAALGQKFQTQ